VAIRAEDAQADSRDTGDPEIADLERWVLSSQCGVNPKAITAGLKATIVRTAQS
jgi:hypothetical protein